MFALRTARVVIALFSIASCAPTIDPRVRAAEDFRSTVFDLIGQDEAQTKRLNALRLGMSGDDVIGAAGSPAKRESRTTDDGAKSKKKKIKETQPSIRERPLAIG